MYLINWIPLTGISQILTFESQEILKNINRTTGEVGVISELAEFENITRVYIENDKENVKC